MQRESEAKSRFDVCWKSLRVPFHVTGMENGALYFLTATRELPSLCTKGGFAIDSRGGCSLGKFPRTGESLGESSRLFQYYSSRSELFSRSPNTTSVGSSIFFLIRIIFPFFFLEEFGICSVGVYYYDITSREERSILSNPFGGDG